MCFEDDFFVSELFAGMSCRRNMSFMGIGRMEKPKLSFSSFRSFNDKLLEQEMDVECRRFMFIMLVGERCCSWCGWLFSHGNVILMDRAGAWLLFKYTLYMIDILYRRVQQEIKRNSLCWWFDMVLMIVRRCERRIACLLHITHDRTCTLSLSISYCKLESNKGGQLFLMACWSRIDFSRIEKTFGDFTPQSNVRKSQSPRASMNSPSFGVSRASENMRWVGHWTVFGALMLAKTGDPRLW